jgi:phosphate transport system substrate-binding protein
MTKAGIVLFAIIILISACKKDSEPSGDTQNPYEIASDSEALIRMGGSYALVPLLEACCDSFNKLYPNVQFETTPSNSREGIRGLEEGRFQIALLSFPFKQANPNDKLFCMNIAQEVVVPMVNKNNPYLDKIRGKGISPKMLQDLYNSGENQDWAIITGSETGDKIHLFTREQGSGTASTWASFIWTRPEDMKAQRVNSEMEMIRQIRENPLAFGYCNLGYVYNSMDAQSIEDLSIVPIDRDMDGVIENTDCQCESAEDIKRCVWLGKFPRDLCRLLRITGNKKIITPEGMAFINFLLHEGQEIAKSMGYCNLNNVQLEYSLKKLEMARNELSE